MVVRIAPCSNSDFLSYHIHRSGSSAVRSKSRHPGTTRTPLCPLLPFEELRLGLVGGVRGVEWSTPHHSLLTSLGGRAS